MVFGCGNKCIKFLVFTFNFLICVAGAVVFGVSLWVNLDNSFETKYWDKLHTNIDISEYKVAVWALVVVGAFLFLVGFLGCCGAACESRCLLGVFCVIVLICFLVQVGGMIAAFVMRGKFKDLIKDGLTEAAKTEDGIKGIEDIQKQFKCCGVDGTELTTKAPCLATWEKKGCVDELWGEIKNNAVIAGAVVGGVLLIQLLAMIFACIMCSAIGTEKYGYA